MLFNAAAHLVVLAGWLAGWLVSWLACLSCLVCTDTHCLFALHFLSKLSSSHGSLICIHKD
ncbi:hypothetical protein T4A_7207 [Trichinella pseudospiralis]|uniref:Uncharacterized protein n=1 Tax=Trichinella pseudospiralis TaxID=6337 RepID=A0A0V1EJK9_TRIPS|nr:hypothetical protein T4A_7207 [Trichinella pseudospiralis]